MKMRGLFYLPAIAAVILMFSCNGNQSGNKLPDLLVQVESGLIKGAIKDDATVAMFKGVPYAAPPVGSPRLPGSSGVRGISYSRSTLRVQ